MYTITQASDQDHIRGIYTLQKKNLKINLSAGEIESQGFVTCDHTMEVLNDMNAPFPHCICLHEGEVVGYALSMLKDFQNRVGELDSMFAKLDSLSYEGHALTDVEYFVMGQICIDKEHRSQGIFEKLYKGLTDQMKPHFELCITEIATENTRSRKAHIRLGFQDLHSYIDPTTNISWELVVLKIF